MSERAKWLTLVTLAGIIFLAGCDGFTSVRGRVLDEQGKPINKAKVSIVVGYGAGETESNEDGSYDVIVSHPPSEESPTLIVTKEGYEKYQQQFKTREEMGATRNIVLKVLSSSKAQSN